MVTSRPEVDPKGLYNISQAAKALGINRSTLQRYADNGYIKFDTRRCSLRRVTTGERIIKLWEGR